MTDSGADVVQTTLDPVDWDGFRALAHRAIDDTIDRARSLQDRPAWTAVPADVRARLATELPQVGVGESAVYEEFKALIEPYTNGNRHPRFFGWVQGNGLPLGALADFLAASMNQHLAGFDQSGPIVEEQVLMWLKQMLGMPGNASGILLSGGTMANLTGVAVARAAKYPGDYGIDGLQGRSTGPMVFYGSRDTHGWATKSAEFLGFGRDAFVAVASNNDFTISLQALKDAVDGDRDRGRVPFCVIGNAGTINTGAIDPMHSLADYCGAEGLWFHVDGAFGALAALSPRYRHLVDGMQRADSIAFDLHKWLSLPFEIGCLLVRDAAAHRRAFSSSGEYIRALDRGVIRGGLLFAGLGIELTRGFKALKAWMCLRAYGVKRFADVIERNISDVQRAAQRIAASNCLELLAPAPLNVVCFRFHQGGLDDAALNSLNQEILYRIQEGGYGVFSSTVLNGRFALRMANVNHRAGYADLLTLIEAVEQIGGKLTAPATTTL